PGGGLGPRTGPVAGAGTRPGFGRLAEVLLATCVVLAAMAALTGVRAVAGGLDRAGAMALGCAAGLAGSLWWMGQGRPWAYAGWLGAALAYPVLPAIGRRLAVAAALGLTATVAVVPAVRALRSRRFAAVATLLAGTGWIGALTLPHLGAWGPVLILVPLGAVPLAVRAGRARAAARRALDTGRHAGLLALARAV